MIRYDATGVEAVASAADATTAAAVPNSAELGDGGPPPAAADPLPAHTDATVITLVLAPTQLGLECFSQAHPATEAAATVAVAAYRRKKRADEPTAGNEAASAGAWVSGFAPSELTRETDGSDDDDGRDGDDEPMTLVVLGGDMLVHATGGMLPATRHRVARWPGVAERKSMIFGCYGADDQALEPAHFREVVGGLPSQPEGVGLSAMSCRASRVQNGPSEFWRQLVDSRYEFGVAEYFQKLDADQVRGDGGVEEVEVS
jgi:hypothetical protein